MCVVCICVVSVCVVCMWYMCIWCVCMCVVSICVWYVYVVCVVYVYVCVWCICGMCVYGIKVGRGPGGERRGVGTTEQRNAHSRRAEVQSIMGTNKRGGTREASTEEEELRSSVCL